ncbi:hypothetical protein M514_08950 [Trichuris suis]|uniref:MICOS complex subunit MIC13 n=1 Tax=Trichuris suis TaxID=68888 RepID=A0A085NLQ2_9BILA|nr:hypothetical protein M513_08950 [Trichuris suis]KFD70398.1 hypothetical protein M514_08950 [Trichuris suis]
MLDLGVQLLHYMANIAEHWMSFNGDRYILSMLFFNHDIPVAVYICAIPAKQDNYCVVQSSDEADTSTCRVTFKFATSTRILNVQSCPRAFARCAVVGSSVAISCKIGVWDNDTTKGSQLLSDLQKAVLPGPVFFYNKLPDFAELGEKAKQEWNRGLLDAFYLYRTWARCQYEDFIENKNAAGPVLSVSTMGGENTLP